MIKLVWLIALACIAWRLYAGRWPWQPKLAAQGKAVPSFEAARARALLGVEAGANRREIVDAHRRRLAAVHPDRGGSNEQVHEANAARDVLLAALPEG
jgi:DnaJ family protein C protein 19